MTRLALLARDVDWGNYLWFVVFIVVPLLARFFKWLFTRLGLLGEGGAPDQQEDPHERLRRRREAQQRAESEGEDLWRKLARGEVGPLPVAPAPLPTPVVPRATSLESEEEPEPLSVLGEVFEPAEAPEVSLETEVEPVALDVLGAPVAMQPPTSAESAPARTPFLLARGDLRRAIVLTEVLGPPVSDRALRA